MTFKDDIGERLKELRSSRNLTQRDFARYLTENGTSSIGAAQTRLTNWETGRYAPSVPYLIKITEIFNVSLKWLITGKDDKQKSEAPSLPLIGGLDTEEEFNLEIQSKQSELITIPKEFQNRRADFLTTVHPMTMGSILIRPNSQLAVRMIDENELPVRVMEQKERRRIIHTILILMKLWTDEGSLEVHLFRAGREESGEIFVRPSRSIRRRHEEVRSYIFLDEICIKYELLGRIVGWIHYERG